MFDVELNKYLSMYMSHKSELCGYDSAIKHGFNSLLDQKSP